MIRFKKFACSILAVLCLCLVTRPILGENLVVTDVKVIHAATDETHVDPGLSAIISELSSVFKYTSYRLLNDKQLSLPFNREGRVTLPEDSTLSVMPSEMDGQRIRYQINILKNNQSVFQTQVLLKDNSSITIGGPQFNNGVLLLNISGSMH